MTGAGLFEARVRGWSRHHVNVCRVVRAMMESLFRAVGYGGLVVDRTKCIDRGDPHCQFDGKWAP
jgi:predicted hydrocarbon binding protein